MEDGTGVDNEARQRTNKGVPGLAATYPAMASLVAQMVKCLPAMRETWVRSLGWEEPLEKEMANHSSTLAGRFHGWRSMVGYSPSGCSESYTTERLHFHISLYPAMEEFGILTVQQTISLITLLTDYIFLFQLLIQDCKS